MMKKLMLPVTLLLCSISCGSGEPRTEWPRTPLAEHLTHLDWSTRWQLTGTIALQFPTYHNQGMVKVGEDYFLSSVNVKQWPQRFGENQDRLGGFDLIDTRDSRMMHQLPIQLFAPSGALMTSNPCTVEATPKGVRAYFISEDDRSTLYIYETASEL